MRRVGWGSRELAPSKTTSSPTVPEYGPPATATGARLVEAPHNPTPMWNRSSVYDVGSRLPSARRRSSSESGEGVALCEEVGLVPHTGKVKLAAAPLALLS